MSFAVDLDEDLLQMPLPVRMNAHPACPIFADIIGESRAKSIPPKPDGFMAHIDTAFVEQIFDISKRKRKSDVKHNGQPDDLGLVLK
jgi:hypothetical protein